MLVKSSLFAVLPMMSKIQLYISSSVVDAKQPLPSFSKHNLVLKNLNGKFMKILEYIILTIPGSNLFVFHLTGSIKAATVADYPFFKIESEELHEVGVGPIHAGIIEPGHFRFICNGEQILHLEIQLGYQHRGIEQLFLEKKEIAATHYTGRKYCG